MSKKVEKNFFYGTIRVVMVEESFSFCPYEGGGEIMEKDRSVKVIAVLALVVAVVGLSLGFAAFTSTLTISPAATVVPEDNMYVIFSNQNGAPSSTTIGGTMNDAMSSARTRLLAENVTAPNLPAAADAVIDNATNKKAPKITNLSATFTAPGQSVTYNFFAYNEMSYQTFLRTITFDTSKYECSPDPGTDSTTATNVCKAITVSVSVGTTGSVATANIAGDGSVTKNQFSAPANTPHTLGATSGEPVSVVISYPSGAAQTNGSVSVTLPDVQVGYSSVSSD